MLPSPESLLHSFPVRVSRFRKDEDHGTAVIREIGICRKQRVRSNVVVVCVLQVRDGLFGGPVRIVNTFVVHDGRLELMLRRNSLQRGIAAVLKVVRGSIPIHDEGLDVEIFGVLNLLSKDIRVLRVIADIDVSRTSKPRLIRSDDLRTALRRRDFRAQRPSDVGTPRSGASRQAKESYGAGEKTKTLKSPE